MKQFRGFTLLEMVVAIGIFSIIAAISYASLDRFLDTRTVIKERHGQLRLLQRTMSLMEMDFRFMVNRPVRDGFGDEEAALIASTDVALADGEFVRLTTSQPDPQLQLTSRLKRIAWRLKEGDLQRVSWSVLDREQDSKEYVTTVLEQVAEATLQYYLYTQDEDLQLQTEWTDGNTLPVGVEFVLTLQNGQQYRRVFAVVGSS